MNLGDDKALYLLPFDHRQSYLTDMFHFKTPLTVPQRDQVIDSKQLIHDAIRAAAFEPRVQRAVAYDVFFDAFDCNLRLMPTSTRRVLLLLLRLKLDVLVNALARRAAKRSLVIEWGLNQAMHVTGTATPAAYLQAIQRYTAAEISGRVTQDVLLLAGTEDHDVPLAQFHQQIAALTNTPSLTARLFTRAESAQSHCQAGNFGLALQVITAWLDSQAARAQKS